MNSPYHRPSREEPDGPPGLDDRLGGRVLGRPAHRRHHEPNGLERGVVGLPRHPPVPRRAYRLFGSRRIFDADIPPSFSSIGHHDLGHRHAVRA